MALQIELVSPERIIFSGTADMMVARTVGGGDIAFMDGHAPFVGALEVATATVTVDGREEQVAVHGGFVEVTSEAPASGEGDEGSGRQTVVTILSDVAELSAEIDVARAQRAKARAEQKLLERHDADTEAELRRAHVRLAAAEAV